MNVKIWVAQSTILYSSLSLTEGSQYLDISNMKNSKKIQQTVIASSHVFWNQDKSFHEKNETQKISLDHPFNRVSTHKQYCYIFVNTLLQ
jgi:hypothetical protein